MVEREHWFTANQQYLMSALHRVRMALLGHAGEEVGPRAPDVMVSEPRDKGPFALETLCRLFALSPFERDLLLLCAGIELDGAFAGWCAKAQGDPQRPYPTFSLALAALPEAHWNAITPTAALRRWRLIEVCAGNNLVESRLRLDERVLHYLTGVSQVDEQLSGFVTPVRVKTELVPSQGSIAEQIATLWSQTGHIDRLPVVQLVGHESFTNKAIAAAACNHLRMGLYQMQAHVIPTTPHELDVLLRLWEREAVLGGAALLLGCEMVDTTDALRQSLLTYFIDHVSSPLLMTVHERRQDQSRPLLTFDVQKPTTREQHTLWQNTLGPAAVHLDGHIDQLTAQFNLSPPMIQAACSQAVEHVNGEDGTAQLATALWQACREQARPRLDDLARRIESVSTWDDLVLPDRERQTLCDIAVHVRQRTRVYETWGFARKSARGLGMSALFAGPSGTGKTMAAEVLANELQLDLYRIDLSQVVSKYIGETEKNLARVFDAAEAGGAILLFDEADALFGKRSEVKDSHDRYANIEVSYLLQRMEAYRGLAILTTNMKSALDTAFLRRLRFVVQFPFPNVEQRAAIWERIFPKETPTERLEVAKLAQLNVTGGNIRNIAVNAAFFAADTGEPVRMKHVLHAAQSEYNKLEKTLTNTEIRGWV
jgi:ATPase family associated with various cellular activities (AAA)